MKEGDYCLVKRDDGKFVPFVYLFKRGNDRSYLFGGIVNYICKEENSPLPKKINIFDYALVHIKCYRENNTPIIGNIIDKIDAIKLSEMKELVKTKNNVWGYKTIIKYANKVEA